MGLFETVGSAEHVDDDSYARQVRKLRADLLDVQYSLKEAGAFPVLILVNGLDGAGKSETVNLLNEWMDPRHIEVHAFPAPGEEDKQRPPMWRFWRALPSNGKIGILFGNWYTDPIVQRARGKGKKSALNQSIKDILSMEKMLTNEGVLLIKYWFHLTEKAQDKRLKQLSANPRTAWRITAHDWKLFKHYDAFVSTSEKVLHETNCIYAPWTVIDGSEENHRALAVGNHLLVTLRKRLAQHKAAQAAKPKLKKTTTPQPASKECNALNTLDLNQQLSDKKYGRELEKWQGELNLLSRHPKFRERAAILVFEGMDAAGKGGAIRRVTAALDARQYQTVPIAAPTEEERAHPYLWRFWNRIPGHGQFVIFDRSWYGRVLVERVEGFCSESDWRRAYSEINDFESQLIGNGAIVSKFWLSVSADEQLQRFKEREETRFKRFKITPEDWRNREQWPLYETAVCDMIENTSTDLAPWQLIASDDKKHARITILKAICQHMEEVL